MNNRLYEHKRSSLEFSESSSEGEEDYKQSHSSKPDRFGESYNSPDQYNSPESYSQEGYGKPNPKSILRDNISASKGKKNIVINETLNETRPIAQKNRDYQTSPSNQLSSDTKDFKYRNYIREDRLGSGTSYSSESPGKEGRSDENDEEDDDEEEYESSQMSSKYSKEEARKPITEFKNRLVVGDTVQAARDEADRIREKWYRETGKRELGTEELEESQGTGHFRSEYSQKKHTHESSKHSDPGSKFEKIENKIQSLEKDLKDYSKSLTQSTKKQEEKNQNLNRVYEDFEDRMKDLKEEINQSISGNKISGESYAAKMGTYNKEKSKSSKLKKSAGKSKKKTVTTLKKLQEEIERLKDENGILMDKIEENEAIENERTLKANEILETDLTREKELLDTIEKIKKKLRRSITKKIQREKEIELEKMKAEKDAMSLGRSFTSYGLHYKDILKRKVLEDKTAMKANCHLLHKGLPITYKNFETPIFAQKLTRTQKNK